MIREFKSGGTAGDEGRVFSLLRGVSGKSFLRSETDDSAEIALNAVSFIDRDIQIEGANCPRDEFEAPLIVDLSFKEPIGVIDDIDSLLNGSCG